MRKALALTGLTVAFFWGTAKPAAELNPIRPSPAASTPAAVATANDESQRLIVKLRPAALRSKAGLAAIASRGKLSMRSSRALSGAIHVVELNSEQDSEPFAAVLARLRTDPDVEYAEIDHWRAAHSLPNDPLYTGQWYLQKAATTPSAINAAEAWDVTVGSAGVVIAVLDTGIRFDHPDLLRTAEGGRLLPGFDFVQNATIANDGDGWDADPTDPGDWVTAAEAPTLGVANCSSSDSSWHGTRVSGMIAALTNNSTGISGATWRGWILPVRVLGKCGGRDSDIIAAMLWSAGIPVAGAAPGE